jgi:glycosyltransferase involved in cell wall biosynthesis
MRTLVIAYEYPWPANSGSRLRLQNTIRGLGRLGPIELFAIAPSERTDFAPPTHGDGATREAVVSIDTKIGLDAIVHPMVPAEFSLRHRESVRAALDRFAPEPQDLVWFFDARAWLLVGDRRKAPTILDLIDLDDWKIRARMGAAHRSGGQGRLTALPGRAWSTLEAERWSRVYKKASRRVRRVVVSSPLDARRAASKGVRNLSVVPNTYPRPSVELGAVEVNSPPTVLFQGTLRYPPNADAARWLAGEIGPALRRLLPDLRIRLVGQGNADLEALNNPPALTVVGKVLEITDELAKADLVVVPVRFGSGTRLKILEAFSHRIPVVSTTLGAEGLGVVDGRHLLLADTAQELAEASTRLLTDQALRRALTDAAHRLYLEQFSDAVGEDRVMEVAVSVGDGR